VNTAPLQRRLAAVFAADVVGYSRLMEANEERTLGALKAHFSEFLHPKFAEHHGRVVKYMGDGVLCEFGSVVDALKCAVAIQQGMPERNRDLPGDRQINFRIGINSGDIMIDGEDIFGDGVNLAARLEGLSHPGGIACSASVHEQAAGKIDIRFVDRGMQRVKNISRPVRVYFVDMGGTLPTGEAANANEAASDGGRQTYLPTVLPSIAVIPFRNMSNDSEQAFFSDGITEDIITDLSKVSGLFVLARNNVFHLKDRNLPTDEIARRLGVAYVVGGSVRKAGNRVRISAQLTDGATGGEIWAERYDDNLDDIFELQDQITRRIVEALKVKLLPEEKQAISQPKANDVDAYTHYLRGRDLFWRRGKARFRAAREEFERAIAIDPGYARAYAGIADCDAFLLIYGDRSIRTEDILAASEQAIGLDRTLAEAHASRGFALHLGQREDEASAAFEEALALDEGSFTANYFYANHCRTTGELDRAAELFERASEVQVDDFRALFALTAIYDMLGQPERAEGANRRTLERARKALDRDPNDTRAAITSAVVLSVLGDADAALAMADKALGAELDGNSMYNLACVFARIGQAARALDLLEECLPTFPAVERDWTWRDPDLAALQNHPRFLKLRETLSGRDGK